MEKIMRRKSVYKYIGMTALTMMCSCASSTSQDDSKQLIVKRTIEIPIKESNSSFEVAWINDSSYLVVDPIALSFYRISGKRIDTLPKPSAEFARKDFHNEIIQTEYGVPILPYIYGGIYAISDTITAYSLPAGSVGLEYATITKNGTIYVWGSHGLWVSKIGSKMLDANSELFRYNTHALFADDTIGIISELNTITFFKDLKVSKTINYSEIGITPSSSSGYWTDWIGKMNGNYYIFQGVTGIKISPAGEVLSTFTSPSNEIVSFTDGDCFFSKRMDLTVWCDDGKKISKLTSQNSDIGDAMIYAGKNSEGHWISDGNKLILLDINKAKSIARK
jgi:hypothetical protein